MKNLIKTESYKCLIIQDGAKVFKTSGSKDKVQREAIQWFKFK